MVIRISREMIVQGTAADAGMIIDSRQSICTGPVNVALAKVRANAKIMRLNCLRCTSCSEGLCFRSRYNEIQTGREKEMSSVGIYIEPSEGNTPQYVRVMLYVIVSKNISEMTMQVL